MGRQLMMDSTPGRDAGRQFKSLIEVSLGIDQFSSSWKNWDRVSSYLARMVSHNRSDPLHFSNLFSSALNELLETAYRQNSGTGDFICRIFRDGVTDRIELTIPCEPAEIAFYRKSVAAACEPGAVEDYRQMLFSGGPLDPRIGLLELAVDYAADISIAVVDYCSVRLSAYFTL
jgi:hypothetical protein